MMEYIPWVTGEQWIADAGELGLPPRSVLEVGTRVCEALGYAHRHQVLHLDIKPGNLFVDSAGDRAKLADFGLAKVVAENRGAMQAVPAGTPAYMPPEQRKHGAVLSAATDVFQLTATLWDLLTGEPPAASQAQGGGHTVPRGVLARLSVGLRSNPSQRPRDGGELLGILQESLALCS